MHNFQPGDLAVIVTCRAAPELVGKSVELVVMLKQHELTEVEECFFKAESESAWVIRGDGLTCRKIGEQFPSATGICAIAEGCLMPLRGDFKPDEDDLAEYADTSFYDLRTGRQRLVGGRA